MEAAKTVQRATRKRAKRTAEAQASKKVWAAREAPLAAEQKAIRETPGTKVTREAKAAKDTMDAKGVTIDTRVTKLTQKVTQWTQRAAQ